MNFWVPPVEYILIPLKSRILTKSSNPSLEKTEIDDIDDSSSYEDDTDESQDVITYEDKDGNERTFVGGKEVTPGDEEVDTSSFIEKLRNYFRKK